MVKITAFISLFIGSSLVLASALPSSNDLVDRQVQNEGLVEGLFIREEKYDDKKDWGKDGKDKDYGYGKGKDGKDKDDGKGKDDDKDGKDKYDGKDKNYGHGDYGHGKDKTVTVTVPKYESKTKYEFKPTTVYVKKPYTTTLYKYKTVTEDPKTVYKFKTKTEYKVKTDYKVKTKVIFKPKPTTVTTTQTVTKKGGYGGSHPTTSKKHGGW